jgi:TonB-linked SusC/RagA family outer membrane protein
MLSSQFGATGWISRLVVLSCAVASTAMSQTTGTIRGRVVDAATKRPLSEAQVAVTGTSAIGVTNLSGDFVIANVPAGQHEIAARRLGYARRAQSVSVTSGSDARVDFELSQTASQLEAIVVTGTAGSAERRTVGNAITQLDVADVTAKTNVASIADILQARSPGVQIEAQSGTVGTASDIRVRGAGGFTVTPPIVFIDGVRMSNAGLGNFNPSGQGLSANSGGQGANALDLVNPNDIESIEIVKGPAAATLYGADAAGGVIQIITKRGSRGQQGVQWTGRIDVGRNDLGSVTLPTDYTTCDSLKLAAPATWPGCQGVSPGTVLTSVPLRDDPGALRNGAVRRYDLAARGGGDRFSYYASGDHSLEEGVLFNNYDLRNALRTNFSYSPDAKTDFQISVAAIDARMRQPLDGESAQGLLFGSYRAQPGKAATLPGETVQGWPFVTPAQSNQYDNETHSDRATVGATLNYQPTSWFHNRLTGGMDWTYSLATLFAPPNTPVLTGDTLGLTAQRVPRNALYTLDYTGSIDHAFGPNLTTTTAFGSQIVAARTDILFASGQGLGTPDVTLIGRTTTITASDTLYSSNSVGYFLQEQFGWKNRGFLTVADRVDNSSVFGSNINVINYPKAQLSWILSEEPRLKGVFDAIRANSVKFRGAWGEAGRAPAPFAASRTYTISVATVGSSTQSAIRTNAYGNPGLKPERGIETELGFDADFLNSRAGLEFTYYDKETRDVLVSTAVPPSTGFRGSQLANLGAVSNKGIEMSMTATPVERRDFVWDSRLSLATNRNRLLSFGDPTIKSQQPFESYGSVQQMRVGYPLGGYWAPYPKRNPDGSLVLVNGAIVLGDTAFVGPAEPTREASFSNTFTIFRNVSVYSLFDYKGGNYNYHGSELYRCASSANCVERNDQSFPASDLPIYMAGTSINPRAVYIYKADFVKLRDVSITYSLPQHLAARAAASAASITLAGHNLRLWSNYPGPDPEVNTYGYQAAVTGSFNHGDIYAMPMSRRLSATLNLTY